MLPALVAMLFTMLTRREGVIRKAETQIPQITAF
jgi:hypothetical protein